MVGKIGIEGASEEAVETGFGSRSGVRGGSAIQSLPNAPILGVSLARRVVSSRSGQMISLGVDCLVHSPRRLSPFVSLTSLNHKGNKKTNTKIKIKEGQRMKKVSVARSLCAAARVAQYHVCASGGTGP